MIPFRRVELSDRDDVTRYFTANGSRIIEGTFIDLFIWRGKYKTVLAFYEGSLFVRVEIDGKHHYMLPAGGDLKRALEILQAHCREAVEELCFATLTEQECEAIEVAMPRAFEFIPDRDRADYLYSAERMINLAGSKLHSKRNFINRFKKEYEGRWTFERMTGEHLDELRAYERRWKRENRTSEGDLEAENNTINELLQNMEALGAVGGILWLDGEIIGFTIGAEVCADTMDIMIEKADWQIAGAYQVLFNEFARLFCERYTYINREDDMGLEGLRKAKMSYFPDMLLMKYFAKEVL